MNLPWGDERTKMFVTNLGLITSDGPIGPNMMTAEWTHHISYEPGLIAVCVNPRDGTHENIAATKEFGVNIAASDQNVLASVAGGSSGRKVNKMKVLEELGFKFYPAKNIKISMLEGAALNIECKLVQQIPLGDHTMFVGEVLDAKVNSGKAALVFSQGQFWKFGEPIQKPPQEELDRISALVQKYAKNPS